MAGCILNSLFSVRRSAKNISLFFLSWRSVWSTPQSEHCSSSLSAESRWTDELWRRPRRPPTASSSETSSGTSFCRSKRNLPENQICKRKTFSLHHLVAKKGITASHSGTLVLVALGRRRSCRRWNVSDNARLRNVLLFVHLQHRVSLQIVPSPVDQSQTCAHHN